MCNLAVLVFVQKVRKKKSSFSSRRYALKAQGEWLNFLKKTKNKKLRLWRICFFQCKGPLRWASDSSVASSPASVSAGKGPELWWGEWGRFAARRAHPGEKDKGIRPGVCVRWCVGPHIETWQRGRTFGVVLRGAGSIARMGKIGPLRLAVTQKVRGLGSLPGGSAAKAVPRCCGSLGVLAFPLRPTLAPTAPLRMLWRALWAKFSFVAHLGGKSGDVLAAELVRRGVPCLFI